MAWRCMVPVVSIIRPLPRRTSHSPVVRGDTFTFLFPLLFWFTYFRELVTLKKRVRTGIKLLLGRAVSSVVTGDIFFVSDIQPKGEGDGELFSRLCAVTHPFRLVGGFFFGWRTLLTRTSISHTPLTLSTRSQRTICSVQADDASLESRSLGQQGGTAVCTKPRSKLYVLWFTSFWNV